MSSCVCKRGGSIFGCERRFCLYKSGKILNRVLKLKECCYFSDCSVLSAGCLEGPQTLEQHACEGEELYINCGELLVIHVVDANYGRLDNSVCADQLGTPNDNCRQDATCFAEKWFAAR